MADIPPMPRPPGTPIPPTPLPDGSSVPSPFYPPTDLNHLAPHDAGRRSSVAFIEPFGTSPVSPRFPPGIGSPPIGSSSGGASSSGEAEAAGSSSDSTNSMRKTPFNFQQSFASKGPVLSKPAQRRGHRYKHSSVSLSHSIFQEPPPRAPLSLPLSLPVPTFFECIASITPQQRLRSCWCLTHISIAAFVLWSAAGSLALTALSHVILFDALGASVCVAVDVISNFEVWKRSTIRHPFGLERVEVLAGFAMSVFLVFMGLDIISHTAEHLLEGFQSFSETEGEAGDHPHDHHSHHARVSPGSIDLASVLAIISTLISAVLLQNHARIGRAMRIPTSSFLPFIPQNTLFANNPSHLLTLIFAIILLILPFLSVAYYSWLDRFLALAIAISMLFMGSRLIKSLGSMLLMSFYSSDAGVIEGLVREVERAGSGVKRVVECKVWQVHYGLGMACFKVILDGAGEEERRVRERISRIVNDQLGAGTGMGSAGGGVRWEVSVAVVVN